MNLLLILAVMALAAGLVIGGLIMSRIFAPRVDSKTKSQTYECGEVSVGPAQAVFAELIEKGLHPKAEAADGRVVILEQDG